MLDLSKYQSIGEALRGMRWDQFSNEVCLIEANREREKRAPDLPLTSGTRRIRLRRPLQDLRILRGLSRQYHHDESVEVADFGVRHFPLAGGVLVPLDYKN